MPFPFDNQTSKKWGFMNQISRHGRKPGPPCRTLEELAEIFGVTKASLKSYMQHNPGAPGPSCTGGRSAYYPLPAMTKWWQEVVLPKRALSKS